MATRLARQQGETAEAQLRTRLRGLSESIGLLLADNKWERTVAFRGSVQEITEKLRVFKLLGFLADNFGWSFGNETKGLVAKITALQAEMNAIGTSAMDPVAQEASVILVDLKDNLHKKNESIRRMRNQLESERSLLGTIESRLAGAKDLSRLRLQNLGIPLHAECPTCHQLITPDVFALSLQTPGELEQYVTVLGRDREAMMAAVDRTARILDHEVRDQVHLEQELLHANEQLRLVNAAVGANREQVLLLANKILALERELERNKKLFDRVDALQRDIDSLAADFAAVAAAESSAAPSDDGNVLSAFLLRLRKSLMDVGHVGAMEAGIDSVTLDRNYLPVVAPERPLQQLGSASDRARLIVSYAHSLLTTARDYHGHHLGWLVMDEPLQQNPDKPHKKQFVHFLCDTLRSDNWQAIVFTSLDDDDVRVLREHSVQVQQLPGEHFLHVISDETS